MAAKKKSATKTPPLPADEPNPDAKKKSDRGLFLLLGIVVIALGALVYWSLPANTTATADDAAAEASSTTPTSDGGKPAKVNLEHLSHAISELSIITAKPEDVVRKTATPEAIAKLLDVRHCGAWCDVLKKAMTEEDRFEADVLKNEEVILPPEDTMDTVAPGMTADERKNIHSRPWAVVLRAQGPVTPDQMTARLAFATALALAEALDGVIYDETCRRIDPPRDFAERLVRSKIGEPPFRPRQTVIQLVKEEDNTARLLTLGMARFGSPDLVLHGPDLTDGPLLSELLNAVSFKIAAGQTAAPIEISLEDVARAQGKKATDLMKDPSASKSVRLELAQATREEGDPDNDLVELVPEGDTTWPEIVTSLFGKVHTIAAPIDKDIATKARKELPKALDRMAKGDGELFVKGPFPIPSASRTDGGPSVEYMWISVASCDDKTCKGTLTNTPSYANNLAAGKTTSVTRSEVVDWVIRLHDGGMSGGDSIKALEKK